MKEIGTDALFALHKIAPQIDKAHGTSYLERVQKFYRQLSGQRPHDLRGAGRRER
ncbi:MAG: hypothetical protein ABIQ47_08315 [Tepidiformaceae bacterium]